MKKKNSPSNDEATRSLMMTKVFGDPETSRMPKEPRNRKVLAVAVVKTAERQKTLRARDVSIERRAPALGPSLGAGIIVADNDPSDHGLVLDGDFSGDRIIVADPDSGPAGGLDTDPFDSFLPSGPVIA